MSASPHSSHHPSPQSIDGSANGSADSRSAPRTLTPGDRRAALALAEAIIPGSSRIPAGNESLVERANELIGNLGPEFLRMWGLAQRALDAAAIARTGHRFSSLSTARMEELLDDWQRDPLLRMPLSVVALVYKLAHFDEPDVYRALGGKPNSIPGKLEQPRWLSQIHRAEEWIGEDEIECEVVVVGTGAGGAVVGRELADRGYAVVFAEEGEHYRRDAFNGSLHRAHKQFYRAAASVGNVVIPIFIGRLVGGSTAVNGGTCFRTPPWILDRWCEDIGSDDFSPDRLDRYYRRVEEIIEVSPAAQPQVGPIQDIIARGCDALGWSHFTINRNTRGCTGGGFCDAGCGTDARRSTNLSYIPPALDSGAQLFTGLRAERILVENGRAVGIEGVTHNGRKLRVRARAVVLAGGTIPTPLLLLKQGIANSSGQVGRNLSLHPSTGLSGLFEDEVRGWEHIPQGYGCDEFLRAGELITAAQPDVNIAPQTFQLTGRRLMDAIELLPNIATLGLLIRDSSANGRVWFGMRDKPAITYSLTREDRDRLHSMTMHAMDMLLAAGARRLYTSRPSVPIVERADVERYRRSPPSLSDMALLSYHPLGTCRMGRDPKTSVVGLDNQSHDIPGLYIVDGSTVRGPLGVNPQLTIMALATRAAGGIGEALG